MGCGAISTAVFLGLGQAGVNGLGCDGETLSGVRDAIDFIAELRQAPKDSVAVGRRVVVIGGGNTAIDAAAQARRLGAEDVTIVYRRGPQQMTATDKEQQWAQTNNVRLRYWAAPTRLLGQDNVLTGVEFARTQLDPAGRLTVTDDTFVLQADMVLKAIGQRFVTDRTPFRLCAMDALRSMPSAAPRCHAFMPAATACKVPT